MSNLFSVILLGTILKCLAQASNKQYHKQTNRKLWLPYQQCKTYNLFYLLVLNLITVLR